MTDIVERLRDKHCCDNGCHCDEAADEIERLRAALKEMLEDWDNLDPDFPEMRVEKARAALGGEE